MLGYFRVIEHPEREGEAGMKGGGKVASRLDQET